MVKQYCLTGHRPEKLGLNSEEDYKFLYRFLKERFVNYPGTYYCGMQAGFDLIAGAAAINCGCNVVSCVPFIGFKPGKLSYFHKLYEEVYSNSVARIIVSTGGYEVWKLLKRNTFMVDNCDEVIAMWDGEKSGGTYHCVNYAESKGKRVTNIFDEFIAFWHMDKISNDYYETLQKLS